MRNLSRTAVALSALALASAVALPTFAQTDADTQASINEAATDPAAFAKMAGSSNQFEIDSSNLALEKSQNEQVRAFAQKMIDDHTAAGEKMMAAVTEAGIEVTAEMSDTDKAKLEELQGATDFDQAYIAAQVAAHDKAVALFEAFSTQADEGPLRAFAGQTLPALQEHQKMVHSMSGL